jgi:hypothetical protein
MASALVRPDTFTAALRCRLHRDQRFVALRLDAPPPVEDARSWEGSFPDFDVMRAREQRSGRNGIEQIVPSRAEDFVPSS